MLGRIYFIARKEFIQLLRDRRIFGMLIIAPIIQLVIFGYVARTDIRKTPMVICDQSRTPDSRDFVSRFVSSGYFKVVGFVDGQDDIDSYLDSGGAILGIIIPTDFARLLKRGEEATVGIYIDGTNSNLATIVSGYAQMIVRGFSGDLAMEYLSSQGIPQLEFPETEPRIWFNPELKSVNFMVPGVMAILTLILLLNLTTLGIVREREQGTAEQLAVTPINPLELLIGKLIPPLFVGYMVITLVLVVGLAWFEITFVGSIAVLYLLSATFILACLSAGLLISTFSYTADQAMWANQVFAIPNILLSGFIFPINNMPEPIQLATYLLPMRYFLIIIRGLFLRGSNITDLWQEALILLAWSVIVITLASLKLKKRLV
jgi:ABC-2 type transport system permease protein